MSEYDSDCAISAEVAHARPPEGAVATRRRAAPAAARATRAEQNAPRGHSSFVIVRYPGSKTPASYDLVERARARLSGSIPQLWDMSYLRECRRHTRPFSNHRPSRRRSIGAAEMSKSKRPKARQQPSHCNISSALVLLAISGVLIGTCWHQFAHRKQMRAAANVEAGAGAEVNAALASQVATLVQAHRFDNAFQIVRELRISGASGKALHALRAHRFPAELSDVDLMRQRFSMDERYTRGEFSLLGLALLNGRLASSQDGGVKLLHNLRAAALRLADELNHIDACRADERAFGVAIRLDLLPQVEAMLRSGCRPPADDPHAWLHAWRNAPAMVSALSKELLKRDDGLESGLGWGTPGCRDGRPDCFLPPLAIWLARSPTLSQLWARAGRRELGRVVHTAETRAAVEEWTLPLLDALIEEGAAGRSQDPTAVGSIDLDAELPDASLSPDWKAGCGVEGCTKMTLGRVLAGAGSLVALGRLHAAGTAHGWTVTDEFEETSVRLSRDGLLDEADRCATQITVAEAEASSGGWSDVSVALSDAFLANATCLRPFAPDAHVATVATTRMPTDRPFVSRGAAISSDVAEWRRRWSRDAFVEIHGRERFATTAFPYAGVYSAKTASTQPSHGSDSRPLSEFVDATRREARTVEATGRVLARRPASAVPYVFSAEHKSRSSRRFLADVAYSLATAMDGECASGERRAPKIIQFFLGPAYSGAPPHVHGAAWNGLAHGLKLWFFFPPSRGYYVSKPIVEWIEEDLPHLPFQPLLAVQRAGDVVHVPPEWSHAVLNLRESIGVAEEYSCQPA